MSDSMKSRALALLSRGWSLIPIQPSGKKPLIEWAEFHNRRATHEEIEAWWTKWPGANIGLVTGRISGVVVVDIDVHKGGSPKPTYDRNNTGLISKTGSGGFHLFYRYPQDVDRVANRVGKDGVDLRGDGGYVVLPPSLHQSGQRYSWLRTDEPGEAPDFVALSAQEEQENKTPGENRWVTELLSGRDEGSRNDSATRLAGYFVSKGMAREVALNLLRMWNGNNHPPLPDKELETTLNSVLRKNSTRPSQQGQQGQSHKPKDFATVDYRSFMMKWANMSVQWAVKDWAPRHTVVFCVSPPGSYKTWTVLDFVVSVAGGKPFLGKYEVLDPGPVILCQQEDYLGAIAERINTIVASKYKTGWTPPIPDVPTEFELGEFDFSPDLPIHIHTERSLRFDDPAILEALEQKVKAIRPKWLVLDPLYSAANTEDFMAGTAEKMFILKKWRDLYGVSSLIVHHTKKSTDQVSVREQAWGSQFLNAFLETGWQIRRVPKSEHAIGIKRHFKAAKDPFAVKLEWDISTDVDTFKYDVHIEEVENWEDAMSEGPDDESLDLLSVIEKSKEPLSASKIAEEKQISRTTVRRKLDGLVKSGVLEKTKEGFYIIKKGQVAI